MAPERGWDGPYHRPRIAAYMRPAPMNIRRLGDIGDTGTLSKNIRQPGRNSGERDDDKQQNDAHRYIGYDGTEYMTHGHLRWGDALHCHQQEPMWRQEQAQLHADQIEHAKPDQIDVEPLHDWHIDRQCDQHHADLVDENS